MIKKQVKDYQTLSVFLILGGLTLIFVLGLQLVLFAPNQSQANKLEKQAAPVIEAGKRP